MTFELTQTQFLLLIIGWLFAAVSAVIIIVSRLKVYNLEAELKESQGTAQQLSDDLFETEKSLSLITEQNLIYEKRLISYEKEVFNRDIMITERDVKIKRLEETITVLDSEILDRNFGIAQRDECIKVLSTKLPHKNQPRDEKGHFAGKKVKKNPDIGKYLCIKSVSNSNPEFTLGKNYVKYEQRTPVDGLILIGDDRSRHLVEYPDYCFQLIEA